jgi:2-oxoglutarate ferredoxin oxidoreductase subunit beta
MLFAGGAKGIALDREALALKVVDVEGGDWQAAGVLVHDPKNRSVAHMLVEMPFGPSRWRSASSTRIRRRPSKAP